jgi:hypothetical protein
LKTNKWFVKLADVGFTLNLGPYDPWIRTPDAPSHHGGLQLNGVALVRIAVVRNYVGGRQLVSLSVILTTEHASMPFAMNRERAACQR